MVIKSTRLEALRKAHHINKSRAAQIADCDRGSYARYEEDINIASMKAEHLVNLAQFYKVSVDYLLGLSDEMHEGNDYIHEQTGLSCEAIECLRELHSVQTEESLKTVGFINFALEQIYHKGIQGKPPLITRGYRRVPNESATVIRDGQGFDPVVVTRSLRNIFSILWEYLFAPPRAWYADAGRGKEKIEPFAFYDEGYGLMPLGADEDLTTLWRRSKVEQIKRWLDNNVNDQSGNMEQIKTAAVEFTKNEKAAIIKALKDESTFEEDE